MTRRVWMLAVFLTFFVGLAQPDPKTCAAFFADVGGVVVADFPQARGVTLADLVTVLTALDPGTIPATLMFADPPARYNPDEHTVVVCTDDYLFVFVNDPFGLRIYNLPAQTSVEAKIMGAAASAQSLRRGIYLVEVFVNGERGTGVVDVNTGEAAVFSAGRLQFLPDRARGRRQISGPDLLLGRTLSLGKREPRALRSFAASRQKRRSCLDRVGVLSS